LIIECNHCKARYQYDEERFERKPAKRIRCAKCQEVFEIHNPAFDAPPKPEVEFDSTLRGRKVKDTKKEAGTAVSAPMPRFHEPESSTGKLAAELSIPEGQRMAIAVIDGPDSGQVYRIEQTRVVIGRAGADMVINDSEASRAHASIEVRGSLVLLQDLGSTNGTRVSGMRIDRPVELQNHGEFNIGTSTLMLIITDDV
jgi:predicted Zn finger-like uncharacterized protein